MMETTELDFTEEDYARSHNSIRLSALNSDISKKISKFNTSSDGALTLEEAVQGLITLQKQSNNYKKILYMVLPILILTIASVFGLTILAVHLTREVKIDSGSSSLKTMSGETVSVGVEYFSQDLFHVAWSPLAAGSLEYVFINTTLFSVVDVHQQFVNGKCRAIIRTESMSLVFDEINGQFDVQVHPSFVNDPLAREMKSSVFAWLDENFPSALVNHGLNKIQIQIRLQEAELSMIKPAARSCTKGTYWCAIKNSCYQNTQPCPISGATSYGAGSSSTGTQKGQKVPLITQGGEQP